MRQVSKFLGALMIGSALALMTSCGGSNQSNRSQSSLTTTTAAAINDIPSDVKDILSLYQGLNGQAPSNQQLADFRNQLAVQASAGNWSFYQSLTDSYKSMDNGTFAKQVLDNLKVTSTTVNANSYAILLNALTQFFAAYGPAARGQIIVNLGSLLFGFQTEATWGTAAKIYANQIAANYDYSSNYTNTTSGSPLSLFSPIPILLPDLRMKFDLLCGDQVNIQSAVAANLTRHTNGKKDLLFTLWCGSQLGASTTSPTVNGLIALIQQDDGSFIDGTKQLFGIDFVDVGGGVANSPVVFDFNNDGYDDVVYAVTGEDGRTLPQGYTGNNRKNFFITSRGNGSYSVANYGLAGYNYAAQLVTNSNGEKDVLTSSIGYGGSNQAFRYTPSGWTSILDYDGLPSNTGSFYSSNNSVIDSVISQSNAGGVNLYKKQNNNSWLSVSSWGFTSIGSAPFKSWNGDVGALTIVRYNGLDYGFVSFSDNCQIKMKPSNQIISLFAVPAQEVVGGYSGQMLVESTNQFAWHLMLVGLTENQGKLTNIPITINNEITDQKFFAMKCIDINSDGNIDIVIYNWGSNAKPLIYVNNEDGSYSAVNQNLLPDSSLSYKDTMSLYEDIDGDGVKDLIYYPLTGVNPGTSRVQFQLFKGNRNISSSDFK